MGRPPAPSITQIAPDRWRVCATVNGRRKKKVQRSREAADALLQSWAGAAPLPLLPTRLTVSELRQAEAAREIFASLGLDLLSAARWLVAHYKAGSGCITWKDAWSEYECLRGRRASAKQLKNVRQAWNSFSSFSGRELVGSPTREEVEEWLATSLAKDCAPATYNHRINDLSAPMAWLAKRGIVSVNPCANVDRQKVVRESPTVLLPAQCEAVLRHAEAHATEWVPWLAVMLFGGVRPGLREAGECRRLSDDLVAGRDVVLPGGVLVRGKAHGERVVPWSASGPLEAWLAAYPLRPLPLPARAEREWTKLRRGLGLAQDVLRHTAASCMTYSGSMTLGEVAMALGNSEAMLRKHYVGRWSREMTAKVWTLLPQTRNSAEMAHSSEAA